MDRGLLHDLVERSNRQRSLKVVEVEVHPPNTNMENVSSSYVAEWLKNRKKRERNESMRLNSIWEGWSGLPVSLCDFVVASATMV